MPKFKRGPSNNARASPISRTRKNNDTVLKTDAQKETLVDILEPYQYTPVNRTTGEIRLITLLPSNNFCDEIRVKLSTICLTTETKSYHQYEALSYVWGSAKTLMKIIVVDGNEDYSLQVTQNLAIVLPYLRSGQPRTLWIDAICINQQDLAERGQQVLRMEDIYAWANRVVVWLGPPNQSNGNALAAMDDLGRRSTVDWHSSTVTWQDKLLALPSSFMDTGSPNNALIDLEKRIPYNKSTLEALSILLSSEWFERLWVWQEIHLANPQAILLCGYDHILWSHFRNAVFCIYTVRRERNDLGSVLQRIFDFCDFAENVHVNSILRATRKLKCMDPRDRIYAIQGILHRIDNNYRVLEPDYSKDSEMKVYEEFVWRCMNGSSGLSILELCSLRGKPATENIPTWIPNFFVKEDIFNERQLMYSFASSTSPYGAPERDSHRSALIIKSFPGNKTITSIQKVIPGERLNFSNTALIIRKFWVLIIRHEGPDSIERRIGPLCRTLVAGHYAESTEPPDKDLLSLSKYEAALHEVLESVSCIFSAETSEFLSFVWDYIQGRVLFITNDGEFGLAPEQSKPGDSIRIFKGSDLPFILRSHGTGTNEYQVVGPCYCSGIMGGEAILGPLPSHYRIVDFYNERANTYVYGFLDTRTGQTQHEDPRLGVLPEDWRREGADEHMNLRYVNEKTGKVCLGDPRLTITALKERGIELEDIVLV